MAFLANFAYTDTKALRQLLAYNHLPEGGYVGYFDAKHKISSKIRLIIALQNKAATIFLKSDIIARIPVYLKSRFPG